MYGYWPSWWWTAYVVGAPMALAIHLADTLPDVVTDTAGGIRGTVHVMGESNALRVGVAATLLPIAFVFAWAIDRRVTIAYAPLGLAAIGAMVGGTIPFPAVARFAWTAAAALTAVAWVFAFLR
jgi:hypothetical protein